MKIRKIDYVVFFIFCYLVTIGIIYLMDKLTPDIFFRLIVPTLATSAILGTITNFTVKRQNKN
ncbi:hypothetical protein PRECH8_08870 [Insulibacter thermoxylanivorax]|uniref:Uncharacterized protein n=1 Tax=Insulibacter thermoxylanivorax TaxID=2749268 RepID=A0A916QFJ5_9BACL|nr:hypothetical protein [Insulibacter thermoxylanivorax]GFR37591.1 hypothetical protein PRECH8_08870 [Insulibacter thermoxylanivorax]